MDPKRSEKKTNEIQNLKISSLNNSIDISLIISKIVLFIKR